MAMRLFGSSLRTSPARRAEPRNRARLGEEEAHAAGGWRGAQEKGVRRTGSRGECTCHQRMCRRRVGGESDRARWRRRREWSSRSEEVKGLQDLGFTFSDTELDVELASIVPSLQKRSDEENRATASTPAAQTSQNETVAPAPRSRGGRTSRRRGMTRKKRSGVFNCRNELYCFSAHENEIYPGQDIRSIHSDSRVW